ncbi:hypothetical protein RclHR1_20290002 [Rhizophagus clarus]|uniref:Uncharacterized protein n=1 Tax=Rhizophagus clarus TaxID=94130 RepID=A0A2Z6R6J0_9GLOM|nr:hypothetical protein RclHR1_20290002 [Rhizophagus clarus]
MYGHVKFCFYIYCCPFPNFNYCCTTFVFASILNRVSFLLPLLHLIIACVLGFVGIVLNNILCVTIFVNYYLVAIIIDFLVSTFFIAALFFYSLSDFCPPGQGRDHENCITVVIILRVVFALLIVFTEIMQVYFCFAIWSYYEKLQENNYGSYRLVSTTKSLLQHMVRFQIKHNLMV